MYELKIYRTVLCHDDEEWCKIWRGIHFLVQNWHEEFGEFWPRALKNLKNLYFNGLLLTKVYNVWAKKTYRGTICGHWRLMQNLKENGLVFSKVTWRTWQIFAYRLKNADFILESKMVKLNQNQNSKQPDRPDTVWKLYFTLETNE